MGEERSGVLVIGAGIAGMEASLLLSSAGLEVHLLDKVSYTGGTSVLFEQAFPNLECATCMLSPRQQDLLQDPKIHLHTLAEVERANPVPGGFEVTIKKRAGFIDPQACIGCGACYDPCPVSKPNEAEMGLSLRKAVYVPFPGALPNVPMIDRDLCLRFQGKECQLCKDACVFEAVDFGQRDEELLLRVRAIIVATGSKATDLALLPRYGHGRLGEVYGALEFERLFSSNGPTGGNIIRRDGTPPGSVALVHCVGREEAGYCSAVCCMYLLKFNHYLRAKIPSVEVHQYFSDLTIPGPSSERFFRRMMEGGTDLVRARNLRVEEGENRPKVVFEDALGQQMERAVDMVVLAPALRPHREAERLAKALGIPLGDFGYYAQGSSGPVSTPRKGIYVIGGAQGPKAMDAAVADAYAAVAHILGKEGRG